MRGLLVSVLALGACMPDPPHATALDAERGNVALGQLQEGRGLLLQKCGNCHRAPLPTEKLAREWPHALDEMAVRSNLDGHQRRLIEQYLVVMATAPAPKK